ncbi:MAG: hypothetical protein LC768_18585, partial [Acidobacteria bacterium]|nr:hypothetical protein [Acidobacteriota bacterium]
ARNKHCQRANFCIGKMEMMFVIHLSMIQPNIRKLELQSTYGHLLPRGLSTYCTKMDCVD